MIRLARGLASITTAYAVSSGVPDPAGRVEREGGVEQLAVVLLDVLPHPAVEVDVAGRDDVRAHPVRRELEGEPGDVVDQRGLHDAVGLLEDVDLTAGHAGDRDDRSLRRLQVRQRGVDQPLGVQDVDLEHGAPRLLVRARGDRADVGDDDVDAAEVLGGVGDPTRERVAVADVQRGPEQPRAARSAAPPRPARRRAALRAQNATRAPSAANHRRRRGRCPASAGDEHDLAGELQVHGSPFSQQGGGLRAQVAVHAAVRIARRAGISWAPWSRRCS